MQHIIIVRDRRETRTYFDQMIYNTDEYYEIFKPEERKILKAGKILTFKPGGVDYVDATALARLAFEAHDAGK